MAQVNLEKSQVVAIRDLVTVLQTRAGLQFAEICKRMSAHLKLECDMSRFQRYYRAADRRKADTKTYDPQELEALVRVFFEDVPPERRCTASEAFKLFSLAAMPITAFQRLKAISPSQDYDEAWGAYTRAQPAQDAAKELKLERPAYPHAFVGRDADMKHLYQRLGVGEAKPAPLTVVRGTTRRISSVPFPIMRSPVLFMK